MNAANGGLLVDNGGAEGFEFLRVANQVHTGLLLPCMIVEFMITSGMVPHAAIITCP